MTTPPPIPGTWQRATWLCWKAVCYLVTGIAEILYALGVLVVVIVFWPIAIPYLVIKYAVAAGIRAGRGED
jgi:hypothetical protein